jgi:chromosome segregation ATPase
MTEQMMIDLMLANQAEIYDKKLAQKQSEVDSMCFYAERLEKQVTQLRAELNDYKDCRHDLLDKVDVLTASLSAAQKRVEEARNAMEDILLNTYYVPDTIQARQTAAAWLKRNTS